MTCWFRTAAITAAITAAASFALGAAASAQESVGIELETSAGTIAVDLYPEAAPITVANFLRYVDAGAYDEGMIWRVVHPGNDNNPATITVIQGGIREGVEPFPEIAHETTEMTGLRHGDGAISMARGAPGTAQAEFFISIGDNPALDFGGARNPDGQGFAVFGQVTEGMEVVRAINAGATVEDADNLYIAGQVLAEPVIIQSARRR
ncbi:MAG: peptidylprolyl isomerase [Parvularculaceae bacterium]